MVASRRYVAVAVAIAVTAVLFLGYTVAILTSNAEDSVIVGVAEEEEAWTDPGGHGGPVRFAFSGDGSRLLIVTPGVVAGARVLDHGMGLVWQLSSNTTASEGVGGASWSAAGGHILVWHGGAPGDAILAFNATTYGPVDLLGVEYAVHPDALRDVDWALLAGDDEMLVVAGRDANDTSRVRCYEVSPFLLHRDNVLAGNATVLTMMVRGNELVMVDSSGSVHVYDTFDWQPSKTYKVVEGPVTAFDILAAPGGVLGDASGHLGLLMLHPGQVLDPLKMRGPVQAVAVGQFLGREFLLGAVERSGGGSDIEIWAVGYTDDKPTVRVGSVKVNGTVTSMVKDPLDPSVILLGASDGRVWRMRVWFTDIEPEHSKEMRHLANEFRNVGLLSSVVTAVLCLLAWRAAPPPDVEGASGRRGRRLKPPRTHTRRR